MPESATPPAILEASPILTGPLRRTVLMLALPVLGEQLFSYLVGLGDTFLSGRISAAATSAVGVAAYVNWLVELLFALVGMGATALVSRHWGSGERPAASRVAHCALAMALVLGVTAVGAMYVVAPVFGAVLELSDEGRALALRYLRLTCVAHVLTSLTLTGASVLRGSGQMRGPMIIQGLVTVLNVLLSALLVYGPGPIPAFGFDGIAWGTILARLAGCVAMLWMLRSATDLRVTLRAAALKDRETMMRILRIGGPGVIDGVCLWSGHFAFLKIISSLNSGAVREAIFAAHVIGVQVEALNYLPASAWGMAAATLIGQNLGAGQRERARAGGHEAVLQACLLAALTSLVFYSGAELIFRWMHSNPLVGSVGVPAMRLLALFEIPLSTAIVYIAAVRGSGHTIPPLIINLCGVFGIRLTLGYWLGVVCQYDLVGAWWAMGVDVTLRAIAIAIYFRLGRWDQRPV